MDSVSAIAQSAMRAAERRLDAAASNIANAQDDGTAPTDGVPQPGNVYQPVQVEQREAPGGGVSASILARATTFGVAADPSSPVAAANGEIATPGVDVPSEVVDVVIAKYQFLAAVKLMQVGGDMQTSTIDTLA